jgi:tetratricopeptide (TPR) repeat protein
LAAATAPLEAEMLADAVDGRYERFSLLSAALIAAGTHDRAQVAAIEQRFWSRLGSSVDALLAETDPARRAKGALLALHAHVLQGKYDPDGDQLAVAIDGGAFNCLSATVLYFALAQRVGLGPVAVATPGHVMTRLVLAREELLIDATAADGIDRVTQAAGSAEPKQRWRQLTAPQLVALIYYNQGVDMLRKQMFAAAYAAGIKASRLDPQHHAAQANLVATLNNWAIEYLQAGAWDDAEQLLRRGLTLAADEPTLRHNLELVQSRRRAQ